MTPYHDRSRIKFFSCHNLKPEALMRLLLAIAVAVWPMAVIAQTDTRPSITVGVQDVRTALDPAMELGNTGFPVTNALFDTLVRRDFKSAKDGTGTAMVPGLASSWERVDDLTVLVKLRNGIRFHNGDPVTGEDIKFTFDRILDPTSKYVSARSQFRAIDHVDVVDASTVRFVTKEPDPTLIKMLAYPGAAIVPKRYYEKVGFDGFGMQPVGAGPYKLVRFAPDDTIKMAAFDDYWAGKPPASSLTFREIPEVASRITALANGEVDIATTLPPDQLSSVRRLSCCEIRGVPVNSHVLNYNTSSPVMANAKFRRGLNLAIDRQLLVDALWNGEATILNGHQYPEWGELYNPDRPKFRYDPEEARRLIKESGYDGGEVTFITHPVYYTNGKASAEAIVKMWRDVGVNAKVMVNEKWSAIPASNPNLQVRNLSDWFVIADPNATILWSWTLTALWKDNDAFQALGKKAGAMLDPKQRRDAYQKMLDIFDQEAPGTVLYRVKEFYGVRKNIQWQPYSVYMLDFRPDNLSFK